jgi:hypothetical protein
MTCRGVVRGRQVELEGEITLAEGTRVRVIPVDADVSTLSAGLTDLTEWLRQARQVRAALPETGDSAELLSALRVGRAQR